jgi:hypothetical protein
VERVKLFGLEERKGGVRERERERERERKEEK